MLFKCDEPKLRYCRYGKFCSHFKHQRLHLQLQRRHCAKKHLPCIRLICKLYGRSCLDDWQEGEHPKLTVTAKNGKQVTTELLDIVATQHSENGMISVSIVNKDPEHAQTLSICFDEMNLSFCQVQEHRITGTDVDSYNDINHNEVMIETLPAKEIQGTYEAVLPAHSINVIDFKF